jgi:hypothetical protein
MFGFLKSIVMEMDEYADYLLPLGLLFVFIIGHVIVQKQNSLKLTLQYRLIFYALV